MYCSPTRVKPYTTLSCGGVIIPLLTGNKEFPFSCEYFFPTLNCSFKHFSWSYPHGFAVIALPVGLFPQGLVTKKLLPISKSPEIGLQL